MPGPLNKVMYIRLIFILLLTVASALAEAKSVEVKAAPGKPGTSSVPGITVVLVDTGDPDFISCVVSVKESLGPVDPGTLFLEDEHRKLARVVLPIQTTKALPNVIPWFEFYIAKDLLARSTLLITKGQGDDLRVYKVRLGTFGIIGKTKKKS